MKKDASAEDIINNATARLNKLAEKYNQQSSRPIGRGIMGHDQKDITQHDINTRARSTIILLIRKVNGIMAQSRSEFDLTVASTKAVVNIINTFSEAAPELGDELLRFEGSLIARLDVLEASEKDLLMHRQPEINALRHQYEKHCALQNVVRTGGPSIGR